ncbi:MAG: hypothetical protein P1P74_11750, partial [Desulfuromonadales bacterium]|nr:hypothetical protein [Desulfuromonadales bacterium]
AGRLPFVRQQKEAKVPALAVGMVVFRLPVRSVMMVVFAAAVLPCTRCGPPFQGRTRQDQVRIDRFYQI